jgi:hypothetical protein
VHRDAVQRAGKLVDKAERRAERAKEGIEEAKVEAARHFARAIVGGNDRASTNGVVRAARMAEITASDEVDSLRAAHEQLRAETAERELVIAEAEAGITVAIRELIAPRVRAALDRLRALDAEAATLVGLLRFVTEGDGQPLRLPPDAFSMEMRLQGLIDAPFADLKEEIERLFRNRHPASAPWSDLQAWQQVAACLRSDPDSLLRA